MKKAMVVLGAVLVFCGVMIGCGESEKRISGKYVTDDPAEYLVLEKDGTFYLKEKSKFMDTPIETTGKWKVDGEEIILSLPMGLVSRGKIKGDTFIDPSGKVWIKEGKQRKKTKPRRDP